MRRQLAALAAAVGVALAGPAVTAAAAPAAAAPHTGVYLANNYHGLTSKPARLGLNDNTVMLRRMHWKTWGASRAVTRSAQYNVGGGTPWEPAKITLTVVLRHKHHRYFSYLVLYDHKDNLLYCFAYGTQSGTLQPVWAQTAGSVHGGGNSC